METVVGERERGLIWRAGFGSLGEDNDNHYKDIISLKLLYSIVTTNYRYGYQT